MMKATLLFLVLINLTAAQVQYGRPGETKEEFEQHQIEHRNARFARWEKRNPDGPSAHMYSMLGHQFQVVYDILSFSLASMMATTVFLWMRVPSISERYKTALIISGLVTFIAAYHYIRIFNSWCDAYHYPSTGEMDAYIKSRPGGIVHGYEAPYHIHHKAIYGQVGPPVLTGIPFNDAYRYMDWLLTVPLLLMEIVLVMKLPPAEANSKCWTLGTFAALMIVSGYKGELVIEGDLTPRWISWCISMSFFLYVVYTLLIGLAQATNAEEDPEIRDLISNAKVVTVISWCTYPIVYLFPMLHIGGSDAVVAIQVGYCCSDIISKCGVGLMIYQITNAKSQAERAKGGY